MIEGSNGGISDVYSQDAVVNQGTIIAGMPGETMMLGGAGTLINGGAIIATNGGNLNINSPLQVGGNGVLVNVGSSTIVLTGNLTGTTVNGAGYEPLGTVQLNGSGTAAAPQLLEAMSRDMGAVAAGFNSNFDYGALVIGGNDYVQLVDNSRNSGSSSAEAVYAVSLTVPAGSTLDLHGLHLYANSANVQGTVLNGSITPTAAPFASAQVAGGNDVAISNGSQSPSAANGTNFGSEQQNTQDQSTFTITNAGIATMTVGTVNLPAGFTLVSPPASSVTAHASTTFVVGLNTAAVGTFNGNVTFSTTDPFNSTFSFAVIGTVAPAEPLAAVSFAGNSVADNSSATATANGTSFGITAITGAPVSHTFTITNNGNAALRTSNLTVPQGFSVFAYPAATSPRARARLLQSFSTMAIGTFSGNVTFTTNDPLNNPYSFAIAGTVLLFPLMDTINGSGRDHLSQDADHQHVDWIMGGTYGELAINDPNGLTINSNGGNDTIRS